MKIIYVLVSSEKDHILEQAMISMHSLRMFNPHASISVVMDRDTFSGLTGNRSRIKRYINEYITPEIPSGLNDTQKSRFLKTSLRKLISGDFLYLDNDTIVTDNIEEIHELPYDVAATLNMHRNDWSKDNIHLMIKWYFQIRGKDVQRDLKITDYYNGGVIFVKDTERAHAFFDKWHELWLKDTQDYKFQKDQISMWEANYQLGNIINELDARYNCQIIYPVYALKYLDSAKILHYFGSTKLASPFKFMNPDYLKKINECGLLKEDEKYISNLKRLYKTILGEIIKEKLLHYNLDNTPLSILGKKLSLYLPWLNTPVKVLLKCAVRLNVYFKIGKSS